VTHFTPEEAIALMDEGGVDAAVIHPPGWDPGSTDMAFAAVRDYPGRFAIMGSLPLDRPESRARIAGWRDQPGMLGLRYTFLHDPARQWLQDGTIDWLWAEAEKAGVPIATLATDSLAELGRIAERHPGLRLTIDHLGGRGGLTTLKDAAAMTHMPELLALAKFPNVAVKATGAPGYSSEAYPFPAMHTYLRQIYDAFGPHRMFWGTDITKMPCSWRQCVTMFTEELPWLSDQDKRLVMGEALCAWWGWDRPPEIRVAAVAKRKRFAMSQQRNSKGKPVAVVVGATSKWQSDGRNTLLAHGKTLDDSDLPVGVRWGVGGAIAQKFAQEGFFVVLTTRTEANASPLAEAIRQQGGDCMIVELDLVSQDSIAARSPRSAATPAIRTF
jgi:predicted TIM-barrel fold metal-dependent hydrolase